MAGTPASNGPAAVAAAAASAPGTGIFDLGIAPSPAPPPLSLNAAKELWIFWYGEEPDLSGLVSPELIACGEYIMYLPGSARGGHAKFLVPEVGAQSGLAFGVPVNVNCLF